MTKETRQLFKYLISNSQSWVGNNDTFQLIISTKYDARLRITIESSGSFEILRTYNTLGVVMDSGNQFAKVSGLKGHQNKIDSELVKKLWIYVKNKCDATYGEEIDRITNKSTSYY